jgi:DeoR/GlpR family transcriptional regulator of sugar metabolism
VSLPTIRRDLAELNAKGLIRRSHGGAMLAGDNNEIPVEFRSTLKTAEKAKMCKVAAGLVKKNYVIFLDASTTVLHIADYIRNIEGITVVTNGLAASNLLCKYNINTFCTGGHLLTSSQAYVGSRAEHFVADFNASIMFFSTSAINKEGLISDYSESETSLRKAMLKHSRLKVFLCDSSKIGRDSVFKVCDINNIDYIITDAPESDVLSPGISFKNIISVGNKNGADSC